MNTGQKVALFIFAPVVITLLLKLVFVILNLIVDDWLNIGSLFRVDIFDFEDSWGFWLVDALLIFYAIFVLMDEE